MNCKKYKVRLGRRYGCDAKIETVDAERETEASVWINGRRSAKESEWANYYDTWEEAHSALLGTHQSYVDSLRVRLQQANGILGNIKGLKP